MLFGAAAISGIVAHQCFFKRVEVDTHPLLIAVGFLAAPVAVKQVLGKCFEQYADISSGTSVLVVACFILSLWTNILFYRAFFHPLGQFPGPFPAKLSKIWALAQAVKSRLQWYHVNVDLHRKYGDFVRTGPRELSVTDPKAISLIYGFTSKTFKGPAYASMEESVSTTRDKVFHKERRQVWDSSMKSLLFRYSPQLELFTDSLLRQIRLNLGQPILINDLAVHYSYDVMTQLAFGESEGFVDGSSSQSADNVVGGIHMAFDAIGLFSHVPWIMTLLTTFASLPGPMRVVNDWSDQALRRRKQRGSMKPDLMAYLLDHTSKDKKGDNLLFAEARVLLVAGSDTTATALSEILILLAHHRSYVSSIREEMEPIFAASTFSSQTAYPVLESVVSEALRLYPPALFASQRETPREGLQVGQVFIPGNTVVSMPHYQLHRDPRNFVNPEEFVPERWTTRSDMILNRSASMPFSMGKSNCPGKSLALMEIRSVVARILNEFDVSFPEGVEFNMSFFDDIKDHFVASVPKQELVFTQRIRR